MNLKQWFASFAGSKQTPVSTSEQWRAAIGGAVGGAFVIVIAKFIGEFTQINDWAMASLGASALLIFVLPSSPMARPKAVVGGHLVAALVGVSCAILIPDPRVGAAIAIGLSILGMLLLDCLHAPAAATALSAVLGHIISYRFMLFPVLVDSILLVIAGVIYNTATGKPYPHRPPVAPPQAPAKKTAVDYSSQIEEVLTRYKEVVDINAGDLAQMIRDVEFYAYERKLKSISCSSIMSSPVVSIEVTTPLGSAWELLRQKHIKALPVTDAAGQVVGILTLEDILAHTSVELNQGSWHRLKRFMGQYVRGTVVAASATTVGQVMRRTVHTIHANGNVSDLVGIFEGTGHHHLPVVDEEKKLVGIITQSDFVKAIHHSMDLLKG